jgi:hypothetical protein
MSQSLPSGYVLPTPQRAKLVGTLNIVFASMLLLYILFQIAMLFATPMIMEMSMGVVKQAQTKVDQQRKDELAELKKEATEAKTDEEKKQAEERLSTLEKTPQVKMPDMSKVTDMMKNPVIRANQWCDFISGLVLNVAMLVSGIGLLQLREGGRRLALWTFGLKIVRLGVLASVMITLILPITAKVSSDMMAGMVKSGAGGPQAAMMGNMAKFQAAFGTAQAVLGVVFGSIWPVIGLILLSRPGTRVACQISELKPKQRFSGEGLS